MSVTSAAASASAPFDTDPFAWLQQLLRFPPPGTMVVRRALILAGVAWVPLLILAVAEGLAVGATPRESLLLDCAPYARYLVAIPAFVIAEHYCLPRLAKIAHEFDHAGLVRDSDQPRYTSLIASTRRLLDMRWVGFVLAAAAYIAALSSLGLAQPVNVSTWIAPGSTGTLSLAGWWRMLVSQPLFLLLYVTWLWRIVLWWRFMWRMSRLDLNLIPSHPDRSAGLHFLSTSLRGFRLVAFAIGASAAGAISEAVFVDGRSPIEFKFVIATLTGILVLLFAGPLCLFYWPLLHVRSRGAYDYGRLADAVGRQFEGRWIGRRNIDDGALSVQDFSATTDLFSVVANVHTMRLVPFPIQTLGPLVASILILFVPVFLSILPLKEVLHYAVKLVL